MTTTKTAGRLGLLSAAAIVALTGSAHAAGFYLQEQSASQLGSAFSGGAANTNDASTIFYNPAGMTGLAGTQIQLGADNLSPDSKLSDRGSTITVAGPATFPAGGNDGGNPYDSINLVPHGYISYQAPSNIWLGLAVTAPYGLSEEYNEGWFGRYDSTKTQLKVIDIAPSIAYKINNQWSVGGGVDFQYATADLEANPSIAGVASAVTQLKGNDWATGYNLGIQYHPTMMTNLGLTYRSHVNHDLEGHIASSGAATFSFPGKANLDLPDQIAFGASQKLNNQWTIQGQVTWFDWSRFHDITATSNNGLLNEVTTENYQNSYSFAAGAEYKANDKWTFRGGMQYDQTPTQDGYRDTRVPDGDRTWLALGTTYNITPSIGVNLGAAYIWVKNEDIDVTRPTGTALGSSTIRASADEHVVVTGLDLSLKF